eukprot:CAMPEP_0177617358 /NCGR_PEP_ID=MMETSP0419_2-20121207/24818_1 /TAXON_ID=582737 /ORGANISM="Tetraselmis sp., Strain GSL018" /LENGTH=286 /DNA_ID=CAMNT_0019115821 /DNA_START=337 /DNA_END=1198 /DNA_ORIENTATION=+
MASCVFVDFLLVGCLIATAGWFISNRFLRKKQMHSHAVEQHVEWLYAFDIHCNSYFPLFILLYVCQFFASPFLLWHSFLSSVISVVLYCFSLTLYHYLTFLGYSALPFLEHTEVFLWPVGVIFFMIPFALITGFNPTRFTLDNTLGDVREGTGRKQLPESAAKTACRWRRAAAACLPGKETGGLRGSRAPPLYLCSSPALSLAAGPSCRSARCFAARVLPSARFSITKTCNSNAHADARCQILGTADRTEAFEPNPNSGRLISRSPCFLTGENARSGADFLPLIAM